VYATPYLDVRNGSSPCAPHGKTPDRREQAQAATLIVVIATPRVSIVLDAQELLGSFPSGDPG
jgi:hypothetical protein